MERKDRIIQTLSMQIAYDAVMKAELLAMVKELEEKLKEVQENAESTT